MRKDICFKMVFGSAEGKKVLEYLEEFARSEDFAFCPDERLEAYLNGQRSVVAEIKKMIEKEVEK